MAGLPHSEEAERAVLGALLLDPQRIAQVRARLELTSSRREVWTR